MNLSIVIDRLEKRFDKLTEPAVSALSTKIECGMVTGLVGPDGAGKTTLMRMLAGLLTPSSGHLSIAGLESAYKTTAIHDVVGYMPQKFGLYEDLTVLENLTLYADLRNVIGQARTASFEQLLAFTDLARFTQRPAGKLSGGMKQKLGLACALLGEPKILLLDEPSVGVDPISRRELWRMVSTLAHKGMVVVWSTSYLDEAEQCHKVLLMNRGQIAYDGTPQHLAQRMLGRSVQIRGIAGNRRRVLAHALRDKKVIDGVIQGGNVRLVLRTADQLPNLAAFEAGPTAHIVPVTPRLEDAFIDILGGGPGGESVLADMLPEQTLPDQVSADAVIEATQLTRIFGDFVATAQIDFKVARGEVFGLLGPNGAGKSTTFKMMCGLLAPSSGTAKVMGIDLKHSASIARQRIGYMAQKFSLYGKLSVSENLYFFSGVYGLRGRKQKHKINEMVQAFALTPYLKMVTNDLPLGFKQRLALACALMHEPALLFLDEPTSGVDPVTRREFWTHINRLVEKGVTVMVTTHFMDEAEYCDRIGLVYRGRLIATGPPDELKSSVTSATLPDPTMEDAFIHLIAASDMAQKETA
jgi:ABC-2 type transport system ATP-binding protein